MKTDKMQLLPATNFCFLVKSGGNLLSKEKKKNLHTKPRLQIAFEMEQHSSILLYKL